MRIASESLNAMNIIGELKAIENPKKEFIVYHATKGYGFHITAVGNPAEVKLAIDPNASLIAVYLDRFDKHIRDEVITDYSDLKAVAERIKDYLI